ncbi:MAG: DUF1801 domain-containing protein [Candidatus Altiarchaeota archaeon]|nr:DUF1801 domain-containing protein [Candidatus Altiarchaeota archaeon]
MDDLDQIFKKLKIILKKYEGPFTPKIDFKLRYELWSIKDLEISGHKKKEVYFAGLIVRSDYVGFYFMPMYTQKNLRNAVGAELLSLLRGKSCFHIKTLNPKLEKEIKNALALGLKLYKKREWV